MRWLISIGLSLATNAIALLAAAVLLDSFEIDATSFVFAVVIFSILSLLLRPILVWMVFRFVRPLGTVVFELLDGPIRRRFILAA